MSSELYYRKIKKVLINNPESTLAVLKKVKQEHILPIMEALENHFNFIIFNGSGDGDKPSDKLRVYYEVVEYIFPDIFEDLVKVNPRALVNNPNLQNLDLCRVALDSLLRNSKRQIVVDFMELQYYDYNMAKKAVSCDPRCLKYVKDEYKTSELSHLAVSKDSTALRYVPEEIQTIELVRLAVEARGKAITWAKITGPEFDELVVEVFTKNMQAMPKPGVIGVSPWVEVKYRDKCIEFNYFPDMEWVTRFNFSSSELYGMYKTRYKWIDSYTIYNLLDDRTKVRALKDGYPPENGQDVLLPIDVSGLSDNELLGVLLYYSKLHSTDHIISELSSERMMKLVQLDPQVIRKISKKYQTEELCYEALKLGGLDVVSYLHKLSPKTIDLLVDESLYSIEG